VAVEELTVTVAGQPVTVARPVERPAEVSYEGVFGQHTAFASTQSRPLMALGPTPIAMKPLPRFTSSGSSGQPMVQLRQEVGVPPSGATLLWSCRPSWQSLFAV
jgi:hypothetical protein